MAIDNPTTNFGWVLPEVGASVGVWGTLLNTVFGDTVTGIDARLKAVSDVADAAVPAAGGTFTGAVTFSAGGAFSSTVAVSGITGMVAADVPNLPASKITTGTFNAAQIPGLPATQLTFGKLNPRRLVSDEDLPSIGTFALLSVGNNSSAEWLESGATGTVIRSTGSAWESAPLVAADIPGLPASKITSGTLDTDRLPTIAAAQVDVDVAKVIVSTLNASGPAPDGTVWFKV